MLFLKILFLCPFIVSSKTLQFISFLFHIFLSLSFFLLFFFLISDVFLSTSVSACLTFLFKADVSFRYSDKWSFVQNVLILVGDRDVRDSPIQKQQIELRFLVDLGIFLQRGTFPCFLKPVVRCTAADSQALSLCLGCACS